IKLFTKTESGFAVFCDDTANHCMIALVRGAVRGRMTTIGGLSRGLLWLIRISTTGRCSHLRWSPLSCAYCHAAKFILSYPGRPMTLQASVNKTTFRDEDKSGKMD